MAKKQVAIKLEKTGDSLFEREAFYGLGPFKAKVNDDDTLTIGIPDHDVQVCTASENQYGTYYTFNIYEGKGFASVIDHERYGTYLRLRLGDNVKLPQEVLDKMSSGGPRKSSGAKKSSGYKKQSTAKANPWT